MTAKTKLPSYSRTSSQRLAAAVVLLLALCAILTSCDARLAESAAPTNVSAGKKGGELHQPVGQEAEGKNMVKAICGANEMRLLVDASKSPAEMKRTKLQLIRNDGGASNIASPDEMRDYTAVGISCAVSEEDGNPYFVVQYGELPWGCKFCEWFYIYDKNGKQLTKSVPVTLRDEALPDTQQQYPNNQEYTVLAERLRLPRTEINYID